MEAILTFVVVVAVKMIDPVSLVAAAAFGALAASRASTEWRWITIVIGTMVVLAALAALSWHLSILDGQPNFRFRWAETAAASFLQIFLICLAAQKWRARRKSDC